jgi:hypothetical protein
MDMYSNLLPSDAESMIDHLLPSSPKNKNEKDVSPFYIHWRGRYGLTESEQHALWSTIDPTPISPSSSAEPEPESEMGKKKVILQFKTFEGEIREVEAEIGDTLLQVARKADLPSMEGSCGGNLGMLCFPSSTLPSGFKIQIRFDSAYSQNAPHVISTSRQRRLFQNRPTKNSTCWVMLSATRKMKVD